MALLRIAGVVQHCKGVAKFSEAKAMRGTEPQGSAWLRRSAATSSDEQQRSGIAEPRNEKQSKKTSHPIFTSTHTAIYTHYRRYILMKTIKVRITTTEEMLGSLPNNKELHETYIASKAPDASTIAEEVAAVGEGAVIEQQMTVFPRFEGRPVLYDYQLKGFFKDSCSALRKVPGTLSSKIKAFKKEIDGLVFVSPRHIPILFDGEVGACQRPLRASTPQGERVALAHSEAVPAGAVLELEITCLVDDYENVVREWLDYGALRGLGQWRNSGKGRLTYEVIG